MYTEPSSSYSWLQAATLHLVHTSTAGWVACVPAILSDTHIVATYRSDTGDSRKNLFMCDTILHVSMFYFRKLVSMVQTLDENSPVGVSGVPSQHITDADV